jgi:hypothetical protein
VKNVQVIDAAENSHFPVFQMTAREFKAIFPGRGQDIAFAEDVVRRLGKKKSDAILSPVWQRPILKKDIVGLHGTLFFGFQDRKIHFPRSRRDIDLSPLGLNEAERALRGHKKR